MAITCAGLRAHRVTLCRVQALTANAVPHAPAPTTNMFMAASPLR
jgi:hypothetical protein